MKGFTLVELIVSVAILSFIVIATTSLFSAGHDVFETSSGSLDMQRLIRQSVGGMAQELRQSSRSDIVIAGDGSTIECRIPTAIDPLTKSDTISYRLVNNQLVREHPAGTQKVLALNIDSLTFSLDDAVLSIQVQARVRMHKREVSFTIQERVTLRS
ncbi:MAG: prepilin-type N-terminal cleavage/methylation domain-containing protein [Candidatus Omnitrophica bacterium]|jgi:prepilin-type N-terminal cleavage/methylation domain|nr:prepilin-type N-terminal cleavage/methylation domain-containing protein [Candidatus Omnitrophota bacterium]